MREIVRDPVEAGARALMKRKSLAWATAPESWRDEQREQARAVLEAAAAARAGGWTDPDEGRIADAAPRFA
jgi:hypothetical protein